MQPDYRVSGYIFADLTTPSKSYGNLMLSSEQQTSFADEQPEMFMPTPAGWVCMANENASQKLGESQALRRRNWQHQRYRKAYEAKQERRAEEFRKQQVAKSRRRQSRHAENGVKPHHYLERTCKTLRGPAPVYSPTKEQDDASVQLQT